MILTTAERPVWRLAYTDHDDTEPQRVVLYTDYLEVTEDLIIFGLALNNIKGEMCGGDGPERNAVAKSALLFIDCYAEHYRRIWDKEEMPTPECVDTTTPTDPWRLVAAAAYITGTDPQERNGRIGIALQKAAQEHYGPNWGVIMREAHEEIGQ